MSLNNEGKEKEVNLGGSQDRFQPEWMSNRKVLSSSGHNTIPSASLGTNGTTLSTISTTSTFSTGGNAPAPYRPHQNFGGSTYAPPTNSSRRGGQHSGGGFESDSFKSVSYRDERQERNRNEKRTQNSFGSATRASGLNYTRKQLLDLFKPSQIPPEFSSLSVIASQESLTPVALLPIELQEEEEKKFAQKGRFNAPGGRSGISTSTGGIGAGRSGRQGPGGAGARNDRDRGRGPAGRGAGGNKGPAWAFEDYGKKNPLSGSLDDLGRKDGAFMGFNGEEDGLGALSQQTAILTAQALQLGNPTLEQQPPLTGSRFTFSQYTEPNPVLDAPLEDDTWVYKDPQGAVQGPFSSEEMNGWFEDGYFNVSLLVKRQYDREFVELGALLNQTGGASPFVSSTINSESLEGGNPVGFSEEPVLRGQSSSFPSSGFDRPFPHELEPPQVVHPHTFDEPFLNMGGRMGVPPLDTHYPASNLPWHIQMQQQPPQPMNPPQHVLHSSLGGFQPEPQHWDSSVVRNMNHLSLSTSSLPTGPSANRREGVFMIDESGQFLPVVEQAAMGLNTDFHRGNAASGSMGNNPVQNTAYPQLWGNQFEANSYVPVAQQAYGTSPQNVPQGESEVQRRPEEDNFWTSTLASHVPSSNFSDASLVVSTPEPVKTVNQKKEKQRNVAPASPQQALPVSSVAAPWSGSNSQKLPSLKEIQEQEMIQQMHFQQQSENFAKQQAVLLARQKEEAKVASAGWKNSSTGTPEKRILSLAEIQEQEMKDQQKKNQLMEEKRIQQQQAAAQAEANAPRWGSTGPSWGNQSGTASLKEIQAAEAKSKNEFQQQQASSISNLAKKKNEPSINLGSAWGAPAVVSKGKPSLKEIQAAEAQQVSGPPTIASIVKAKPPVANIPVAAVQTPSKSDSSDLFWDVSEEPKAVTPSPQQQPPKTPTKAVSDQDFPSLGGKSAKPVDINDVQGWTVGQLRGFALIKSQDPNAVASALVKLNNANEMKEFLKGKVPQGDTLNRFVNELVRRKNLKANGPPQPLSQIVIQKAQPAEKPVPVSAPQQPPQPQAPAGGKKKKKSQPVDPRLLGFSVNNTNRVMGEIESLDR